MEVRSPGREVLIEEELMPWRGRFVFRQYIPGKSHKYGIKLYMLCDPDGYIYNLKIYGGKEEPIQGFGCSESVVFGLMDYILDKGHEVYVDSYYTSLPLANKLLERNTNLVGTFRKDR